MHEFLLSIFIMGHLCVFVTSLAHNLLNPIAVMYQHVSGRLIKGFWATFVRVNQFNTNQARSRVTRTSPPLRSGPNGSWGGYRTTSSPTRRPSQGCSTRWPSETATIKGPRWARRSFPTPRAHRQPSPREPRRSPARQRGGSRRPCRRSHPPTLTSTAEPPAGGHATPLSRLHTDAEELLNEFHADRQGVRHQVPSGITTRLPGHRVTVSPCHQMVCSSLLSTRTVR